MPSEIFFISDTHFGHENILKYDNRPFDTIGEHDEILIQNWNSVVKPGDHVWHLGDVFMGSALNAHQILSRLNGKKRLVVGNHDDLKSTVLHTYFQKLVMWRRFDEFGFLCTHVPIHESSLFRQKMDGGYYIGNVHGHIHRKESPTKHHLNISCTETNYTPVHLDEVVSRLEKGKYKEHERGKYAL